MFSVLSQWRAYVALLLAVLVGGGIFAAPVSADAFPTQNTPVVSVEVDGYNVTVTWEHEWLGHEVFHHGYDLQIENYRFPLFGLVSSDHREYSFVGGWGDVFQISVRAVSSNSSEWSDPIEVRMPYYSSPVQNLEAIHGDSSVELRWDPPEHPGGELLYYEVDASTLMGPQLVDVDERSIVIPAPIGREVSYRVTVVNEHRRGLGTWGSTTVYVPPSAPRSVEVVPGDSSVEVTFVEPADTGGASAMSYEVSVDGGHTWDDLPTVVDSGSGVVSAVVDGLANGTPYEVVVRADNGAFVGEATEPVVVTPRTLPGVPASVVVVPHSGQLTVVATPPDSDGGFPVIDYEYNLGSGWVSGGPNPMFTVGGLDNGVTYTVAVRAVTEEGAGPAAAEVTATPTGVPGPPEVVVVSGDRYLTAHISAGSDGGSPLAGFEITIDGGQTWEPVGLTTKVDRWGLANGVSYPVMVRAVNSNGTGAPSPVVLATPEGGDSSGDGDVIDDFDYDDELPPPDKDPDVGAGDNNIGEDNKDNSDDRGDRGATDARGDRGATDGEGDRGGTDDEGDPDDTSDRLTPKQPRLPTPDPVATEHSAVGTIHRLYLGLFGRVPDPGGLAYWTGVAGSGVSLNEIASGFMGSPEWQNILTTPSDDDFVGVLYQRILGRAPDDGGRSYWLGVLADAQMRRSDMVMFFINSNEFIGIVANV